jgi:putative transposase
MPSYVTTYRYRIKDSVSSKHLIRMAWAVNTVYNYCNEVSIMAWRRDKKWLSAYDLQKLTSGCGSVLGLHSQTIQAICEEFATRRKQFKKVKLNWRSRKRSLGWIPFKQSGVKVVDDTIRYAKHRYRFWKSQDIGGQIKTGSFTQDARGRWYVNLQCEVEMPELEKPGIPIGIDLGLKDTAACSDGIKYNRENITRQYADELGRAQRAGKKKRTQAIHAKVANKRKDFAHKATTKIVRRASYIAVGNVSSAKLVKTRFAKSVYDAGWHQFRSLLEYKAIRLGVVYADVNESFSSVTCSACLQRTGPSGLSALGVREWCCTNCGVIHDRDVNAALNILRTGRCTPIKGIPLLELGEDVKFVILGIGKVCMRWFPTICLPAASEMILAYAIKRGSLVNSCAI